MDGVGAGPLMHWSMNGSPRDLGVGANPLEEREPTRRDEKASGALMSEGGRE